MSIDVVPKPFREPWEGDTKIVIGINIGTTQSSVAFAFLQNGTDQVRSFHRVSTWPGQEAQMQLDRIPTLVWYDTNKKAVSFGAEALLHTTEEQAEDNNWVLAKYFKLHLHPSDMQAKHELKLDPLPPGVTLRQIYSDFLRYLLEHTRAYFEDRLVDGEQIWERYSPTMEVVIAHPNGWGVREQHFLRSAVIATRFFAEDQALSQVRFVIETEASVHFCIYHTNLGSALQPGTNFVVCDAGTSTADTTLYSVVSTRPVLKFEEKRVPACVCVGSVFVDAAIEQFLRKTLSSAGLDPDDAAEYTKAGVKDFSVFAKWAFKDETVEQSITLAHTRFNYPGIRVRRGRMLLPGSTIKGFFDVCVKEIIASVDEQLYGLSVRHILLIGEFGNSPYLRQVFQKRYEPQGHQVSFVDEYSSGAISDGAVLWGAMHQSKGRTLRSSWGIETSIAFDYNNPEHRDRGNQSFTLGRTVVPGRWHGLLRKGVVIDKDSIARVPISLDFPPSPPELGEFKLDLYHYSGNDEPVWMMNRQGGLLPEFCKVVRIYSNLNDFRGALKSRITRDGVLQCQLNFDVCMRFGNVELAAYSEWEEEGIMRVCPCTVVPIVDEA